jgi:cysteinyl-tRNA synthetase
LCDDLNTPKLITTLHGLQTKGDSVGLAGTLRALGFGKAPESKKTVDTEFVETLVAARLEARRNKDFKEADRIRDQLAALGVVLKDSKDTTTWEIAR